MAAGGRVTTRGATAGRERLPFPFGVYPAPDDETAEASRDDDRGPDTANRLLLHGARHHDREAVFLHWGQGRGGWGWQPTPDWTADRTTIRTALVLRQRVGMGEGDRVGMWFPLGPEWAEIERAVWSVGGVSVPVWPEWPIERVAAVVAESEPAVLFAPSLDSVRELEAIGGRPEGLDAIVCLRAPEAQGEDWLSLEKFLEYGGVLDTPERASMWRTYARGVRPGATASLEFGETAEAAPGEATAGRARELDQGELVAAATRLAGRFPPRRGRVRLLATDRPEPLSRLLLLAGWADGLTRMAFAPGVAARGRAGELGADVQVVACRADDAAVLARAVEASRAASRARAGDADVPGPLERLVRRLRGAPPGEAETSEEDGGPWVVVIDGAGPGLDAPGARPSGAERFRVVNAAELLGGTPGFPTDRIDVDMDGGRLEKGRAEGA